jgi:hypothetical protein
MVLPIISAATLLLKAKEQTVLIEFFKKGVIDKRYTYNIFFKKENLKISATSIISTSIFFKPDKKA